MSTNPIGAEFTIREAVKEKIYSLPLDKVIGQPTMKTWQHAREQICKIVAQVKSTHWGGRHGHLPLVLTDGEFQTITGDPTSTTDRQNKPPLVHPLIDNNTTTLERAQLNASQSIKLTAYYTQEVTDEVMVERLVNEIFDKHYVEDMEDKYVGFANQTIKTILNHIKNEWVIVTTNDISEAKTAFNEPWDMTSPITKFIRSLDEKADYCRLLGMDDITNNSKVQVLVENMYASDMFTDTEMDDWETAVDKSWAAAVAYFNKLYKKKKMFNEQRANRRSGYDSANSISDQSSAKHFNPPPSDTASVPGSVLTSNTGMTLDEQRTMVEYTQNLEAKLNDKEQEFAAAMTTTQSNVMEQMQQQQKLMMEQQQKFMEMMMGKLSQLNNTTTQPGTTNNDGKESEKKGRGHIKYPECKHCGKRGKHALTPDECLSLEKNKDKRPAGYKE